MAPVIIYLLVIIYMGYLYQILRKKRRFDRQLQSIEVRVHVNGIRGKSTVTRLVGSVLRSSGKQTLGKTTGTTASLITSDQDETIIKRKKPNINEQVNLLSQVEGYDAIVFECMAINPLYQRYSNDNVIQPTIGIVTNIREDHMGVMGDTLDDICEVFCYSIPYGGIFITSEDNPAYLERFQQVCEVRKSEFYAVSEADVSTSEMIGFTHFEYRSNVAIALKIADLFGVDRAQALGNMKQSKADPGAFELERYELATTQEEPIQLKWANLFAINDKESFILTVTQLYGMFLEDYTTVVILNNRIDRPERVMLFFEIVAKDLPCDYIVTFGEYETTINQQADALGLSDKVINLGESTAFSKASGQELIQEIAKQTQSNRLFLIGAVNIHTPQAVELLATIETLSPLKEESVLSEQVTSDS